MTQLVKKVSSGGVYEKIYSYSRIIRIGDLILMSNTAGRNYKTGFMSTDAIEQAEQILANAEGALASVESSLPDVVRIRVSIPDPADVKPIMTYLGKRFQDIDPVLTVTCTPLASTEYKLEIELTAHAGVAGANVERISVVL